MSKYHIDLGPHGDLIEIKVVNEEDKTVKVLCAKKDIREASDVAFYLEEVFHRIEMDAINESFKRAMASLTDVN